MPSKVPDSTRFWHPEYIPYQEKDILIVWYYANQPDNPIPKRRLTFKHLAAIRKASFSKEYFQKIDMKIGNLQDYEKMVLNLINFIEHVNFYDGEFSKLTLGMNEYSNEKRKKYVLDRLKLKFPRATVNLMDKGYELSSFLETLQKGFNLEEEYLRSLENQYEIVPDDIKKEFDLQAL